MCPSDRLISAKDLLTALHLQLRTLCLLLSSTVTLCLCLSLGYIIIISSSIILIIILIVMQIFAISVLGKGWWPWLSGNGSTRVTLFDAGLV